MSEVPARENEEFWHEFLTGGHAKERAGRWLFKLIPHDPRCGLCAAPFEGPGAPLMRLIGKKPSDMNPKWCSTCFDFLSEHHGGAEIECTMLFADIRGSTTLAEQMSSTEFRRLMDRFYDTAAAAGEILVTSQAAAAARLERDLERRTLELKSKERTTEVVILTVAPAGV